MSELLRYPSAAIHGHAFNSALLPPTTFVWVPFDVPHLFESYVGKTYLPLLNGGSVTKIGDGVTP